MEINSYKIKLPFFYDIELDVNDIVNWFEEASCSDIQNAIHLIGLALNNRDDSNLLTHNISEMVASNSKDFWNRLVKEMNK